MNLRFSRALRGAALACALLAGAVRAGSFDVNPIRLDFDRANKTGAITLSSDDERPLSFQLSLFKWQQNAQGEDQLEPSADLIYFPQILTLAPKEQRLIRVGIKGLPTAAEQTYRLFIEELPEPVEAGAKGTQIAVKLRFGVPLFVAPPGVQLSGLIENVSIARGEVHFRVRNTGNVHFKPDTVSVAAGDAALGQTQGWYVLSGAAHDYTVKLDQKACAAQRKLQIAVKAEGLSLKQELDASPAQCHS